MNAGTMTRSDHGAPPGLAAAPVSPANAPRALRPRVRWGLVFVVWSGIGLFFSTQHYLLMRRHVEQPLMWAKSVRSTMPDWYLWAILAPLVFWLARRYPVERSRWLRGLAVHVPASALISLVHLVLAVTIYRLLQPAHEISPAWKMDFEVNFAFFYHWYIVFYVVLAAIGHARDYYFMFQERAQKASRLEARLAQAQLHALQAQLQPHFLFNTLNAIAELTHEDPRAAERMILRLSDLLRQTLRQTGIHEVPLRQELEFISRYLELEQTRFTDRLCVCFQAPEETLSAMTPNLILQPLVENAIRHGISAMRSAGRIDISARRENGVLHLEVRDNGPGLPQDGSFLPGVGLSNTQERLTQLYGQAARLELANAPGGGLAAGVAIPFRTEQKSTVQRQALPEVECPSEP